MCESDDRRAAVARRVRVELAPVPASAGVARRFLRAALREWKWEGPTDELVLAANEVVTNAVVHARSSFTLTLLESNGRTRVEVRDRSFREPLRLATAGPTTSGRGLELVDRLVDTWGVEMADDGKIVWFEM